ncbi:DivIVA domain-containing protein [Bifidobacterium sp. CP2]|uniref:DivIVA domain-containing protein n=1 Tax=Bifidobacterium sp. CP2 TaxID=2809025 RepID=UPI0023E7DB50|nr:DivIVA domain-containing protein [Bifidobacterium sp. CP2]
MIDVESVRNKIFSTVRFREGYDVDEVDDFLDVVMERMKAGRPMTAAELSSQTFSTVRLKQGYDVGEVDEFLAELAADASERPADASAAPSGTSSSSFRPFASAPSSSDSQAVAPSGADGSPFSGGAAQVAW